MERNIGRELINEIGKEGLFEAIINYSSPETRNHYKEIDQKLGSNYIRGLDVEEITTKIINDNNLTKIIDIYGKLVDLTYDHLKFIPGHTEKKLGDPIMGDFHHSSPGDYGHEIEEVKIPEHWTIDDEGKKEIDKYTDELKEIYKPKKQVTIFKKLFSKKP